MGEWTGVAILEKNLAALVQLKYASIYDAVILPLDECYRYSHKD